ncbi:hypothetical protein NPIL_202811, partial [Nephila pilipes]
GDTKMFDFGAPLNVAIKKFELFGWRGTMPLRKSRALILEVLTAIHQREENMIFAEDDGFVYSVLMAIRQRAECFPSLIVVGLGEVGISISEETGA